MISKNTIKLIRSLEQKKHRSREGLFVAEGPIVVADLMVAGFVPQLLFATKEWSGAAEQDGMVQVVSDDELRKLSFLQHPQQVLAVFRLPNRQQPTANCQQPTANRQPTIASSQPPTASSHQLYLVLDGVQDPGNLGTIVRLADWFGIDTVYCSEDTADAWSPKVVQATMGSIARVKVVYTDLEALLSQTDMPVYGTLLDGDNIYGQELTNHGFIVMGNEGNGISPAIRRHITRKLLIPKFHEGPESLNVAIATAIVCSEFKRGEH